MTIIKCPVYSCGKTAVADVEWGSTPQRASFCPEHLDELWNKSATLVNAGLMHWRMGAVGSLTIKEGACNESR